MRSLEYYLEHIAQHEIGFYEMKRKKVYISVVIILLEVRGNHGIKVKTD